MELQYFWNIMSHALTKMSHALTKMSHALTKMQGVPSGNQPNTGSDSEISQNQSRPNRPTSRFGGFSHQRNTQNTNFSDSQGHLQRDRRGICCEWKGCCWEEGWEAATQKTSGAVGMLRSHPLVDHLVIEMAWNGYFWGFTVYTIVSDATVFLVGRQTPEQEHVFCCKAWWSLHFLPTKIPMSMSEKKPMCFFPGNTGKTPHVCRSNLHCLIPIFARQATAISTLEMLAAATPFVLPRLKQWRCVPRKWCLI